MELELEGRDSQLPGPSVETSAEAAEGESKEAEGGEEDGKGEEVSEVAKAGDHGSESSSEMDNLSEAESSLDQKLSAVEDDPLHIEESDTSQGDLSSPQENGLENGAVSALKGLSVAAKVC